jgi:hypothetical protein
MFNSRSGHVTELQHYHDNLLFACTIIQFAEFIGIEMDRYRCTITRLWGSIPYSVHRVDLMLYWMEETRRRILKLNNDDYIHCNLFITNVAADCSGRIRLRNFD